jgi:hypothetical protein
MPILLTPTNNVYDAIGNWWANLVAPVKGGEVVTSPNITTKPLSPTTEGAMTQLGVWTPEYAMQRTYSDEGLSVAMQQAAGDVWSGVTPSPMPTTESVITWWQLAIFAGLGIWFIQAIGDRRR